MLHAKYKFPLSCFEVFLAKLGFGAAVCIGRRLLSRSEPAGSNRAGELQKKAPKVLESPDAKLKWAPGSTAHAERALRRRDDVVGPVRESRPYTVKLTPQPHEATAFGFFTLNAWPIRSSTKSSSEPTSISSETGSTMTFAPSRVTTRSSSALPFSMSNAY